MSKRDRTLYLIELRNGNWAVISRIENEAKRELSYWQKIDPKAKLITTTIPEADQ